jgi:hypothetical protein
MRFNDGAADGQIHTRPVKFRADDGIEDLVRLLRRQPPTPSALTRSFALPRCARWPPAKHPAIFKVNGLGINPKLSVGTCGWQIGFDQRLQL